MSNTKISNSDTPDKIINSALKSYCIEIVSSSAWMRTFIMSANIKSAKFQSKEVKNEFLKNRCDKKAKTIVKPC